MNAPYGYQYANGLNFSKSVSDPNSALARMVNYIRKNGPSTRKDILSKVFQIDETNVASPRGWSGHMFSGAKIAGFITYRRVGRTVLYDLGPLSNLVV